MPNARIKPRLEPPSSINDRAATAMTRPPAVATARTSVLRPRTAIEMTVSVLLIAARGSSAACGTAPADLRATSARKPMMYQGTSLCSSD
jgi:hypothetical protein